MDKRFATLVQKVREEKKISLRSASEKGGLSTSTVNRIEHGLINPTVETGLRVAYALDITRFDFYEFISGKPRPQIPNGKMVKESKGSVVTLEDAICFNHFASTYPELGLEILSKSFNRAYTAQTSKKRPKSYKEFFNPQNLEILILNPPYFHTNLRHPNLKYKTILGIYQRGGIITSMDTLNFYLAPLTESRRTPKRKTNKGPLFGKARKKEKPEDKKPPAPDLFGPLNLPENLRRLKLADLILASESFSDTGELLLMSWQAAEYDMIITQESYFTQYNGVNYSREWKRLQPHKWGHLLVFVSRWLEKLEAVGPEWMPELRMTMENRLPEFDPEKIIRETFAKEYIGSTPVLDEVDD